ncbi:uncharacterized protein LOC124381758 isoform X1 [Silurus meridionalis]|uniref:uncharacterized protein LOC124381758 isoform X1 n=1 Tax=Silurus meridionalis TaxID=175797 RepID=UPI001EECBA7B|nr:uncharacterized protein LOC124381758 isoform X1 [Silurus meridionalis]
MEPPVKFQDGNSLPVHREIQRESLPGPSCVSMNSDESIQLPFNFSNENPSPVHSYDPESAVVDEFQKRYKFNLKKKFQCINGVIVNQDNRMLLNEIYTELYITEGDSGDINKEHEVRLIEAASRRKTTKETPIKCNDIFKSFPEEDKPIRTVLMKGIAGIGKTISVQKFILDWTEGEANQDIPFIFPLPFRELNLMKDQKLSLVELLHVFSSETKEIEKSRMEKALFIFDGLDEYRFPLDFQNTETVCDVTESASVHVLLINLIIGNLLPSALIWITSRPAAADQIPSQCVHRVTEVRGFSDPQKEEYFRRRFSDQKLASNIITHLKSLRSLYIMCHIPVFCWISAAVLERMLGESESGEIPKTLTQMYTHFLIIQTNIIREKYSEMQESDEEMILKLGRLAFQQLKKGNLIFYEEDLRECGIDVTEAAVYSGVCTQIFREEFGLHQCKVYCFVHLSIQEHLAALYVHLTFMKENVFQQNQVCRTLSNVHRCAVDQAIKNQAGHLDLFLRFLLGLSLESNQKLLLALVKHTGSSSQSKEEAVQYIKEKISKDLPTERSIILFHCLNELGDNSLVEEIQQYLKSGKQSELSSLQWSALVFVLLTSAQEQEEFDLSKYTSSENIKDDVLVKLMPVISASRKAIIKCDTMKRGSCSALVSVLNSETSSLKQLHLTVNTLNLSSDKQDDSRMKNLSVLLENPHCKIKNLKLDSCDLSVEGCTILASALRSNPSHLRELDLSENELGDTGVKNLSAILENLHCKLETLRLRICEISGEGCDALKSALSSNPSHLRELDLHGNRIGDSGVEFLSDALENPHCKLERLGLEYCEITDKGCAALTSALKSNPSHLRYLDLSQNKVEDAGAKCLATVLENPQCKLETLRLYSCGITDEGFVALNSALKSNPSHLRNLNLYGNKIGQKLLSDLKNNEYSKLQEMIELRRKRSESPEPSCVSMKSDESMDHPLRFSDGNSSPVHSELQRKRSESPEPSCVSMKSEESMDHPLRFRDGNSSPVHSELQRKRSESAEPSCVSMKSEESMDHPLRFRDGNSSPVHSELQRKRPVSPEPSCVSMKSHESMDHPLRFSDGKSSSVHSVLQKAGEKIITVTGYDPESASVDKLQKTYKFNMKKKVQCINDVIMNQENRTLLNEIYTELYITEGDSGDINKEHEVRQIEAASRRKTTKETPIKWNDIFKSFPKEDKPIRTVLMKGVAGIGKTVSVQKFILDWTEGKANQNIPFIFPLPFRELNLMKDQKLSLVELLHVCFKETKEIEKSRMEKALFIFDGLDEYRFPLDFQNTETVCDVTESASVHVLLINLIKGNLLPSALIWITSRPAAADQIPSQCVHRVTEVRGFSDPQKEEYFRKRISDQNLANNIITHLKSLRSLYIMCHIPVFCWISASVLERMLGESESGEIPKTLTQMYTHFLIIQTNIIREKYLKMQESDEEMILKLGRLAFQQLEKGNLIFYEEDLRECGIDVTEAAVYSGVCTQIFREDFGLHQCKVYCFVHLSIQEHLAALYVHLTFMKEKKNIFQQNQVCRTLSDVHRSAVNQTLNTETGHLDLFLRFLLGLSLESNQKLLLALVKHTGSSSQSKAETVQYIKEKISEDLPTEKSINLFHCLNELGDSSLVEEIQQYLKSGKQSELSSLQWSALVFILLTSAQEQEEFDLSKYTSPENIKDDVLVKFMPVISASRKAIIKCDTMKRGNCSALVLVLNSETSSLKQLHLTVNTLDVSLNQQDDSGMKNLSVLLENPHCKIKNLKLDSCDLSVEGCAALTSALRANPSHLRELDLSGNDLGDTGVKDLSSVIENLHCKLEILRLRICEISGEGCDALKSALSSNPSHLRELDLHGNRIGDSGVKFLSDALENPHCKLERLGLDYCEITVEGCAALTSALKSNPSHLRYLDLSQNKVGDAGVKCLATVLENPQCKLETLRLYNCGIRDEGCVALNSALKSNPSHLRNLDLYGNKIGESGQKLLSDLKNNEHYKLQKLIFSRC